MNYKEILGLVAAALALAATIPYLWKTWKGILRPHIFTWTIWSLTTLIAAAGRTSAHAGAGAWGQWVSGACCLSIALLALRNGENNITPSDKAMFLAALSAIPVWMMMGDPLYAVIIATAIDLAGYYPTMRKAYTAPYQEATFNFHIANLIHVISFAATDVYNVTNLLFPVCLLIANSVVIALILWRRRSVPRTVAQP